MKIKILKAFPTTHHGQLAVGQEIEVSDGFGRYCIERLKAAEEIKPAKRKAPVKRTTKKTK